MKAQTRQFREHFREEIIPKMYNGRLHVLFSFSSLIGSLIVLSLALSNPSFKEFLIIPVMLIFGNLAVFIIHKYPLHRPIPGMKTAYKIHTKWHHQFFTDEATTYDSPRDFFILFFPTWSVGGFTYIFLPILFYVLQSFISTNFAALTCIGASLYFLGYELVHFMSHVSDTHPLLKIKFFSFMREYHRDHHNPKLMNKHNFNIVFPLFDFIFGAYYKRK